jgi:hypothetical protein
VISFKNKIIVEKNVLFQSFRNQVEFDDQIRGCITSYVQSLQREEAEKRSDETERRSSGTSEAVKAPSSQRSTPFSDETTNFLHAFIESKERDFAAEPVSSVEVARFRLLGTMISAHGNDETTLGAHDANIIYSERASVTLSMQEKVGLIDAALYGFSNHNIPLWYWLENLSGTMAGDLTVASMFGSVSCRIGALAAMRLVAEPINPIKNFGTGEIALDRAAIVRSWFKEKSDADLRVAALEYLAICGTSAELSSIRAELDRGNYRTIGPATDAFIRINLKESREDALKAIYDSQPESIDQALVTVVFSNPKSFNTSL